MSSSPKVREVFGEMQCCGEEEGNAYEQKGQS